MIYGKEDLDEKVEVIVRLSRMGVDIYAIAHELKMEISVVRAVLNAQAERDKVTENNSADGKQLLTEVPKGKNELSTLRG